MIRLWIFQIWQHKSKQSVSTNKRKRCPKRKRNHKTELRTTNNHMHVQGPSPWYLTAYHNIPTDFISSQQWLECQMHNIITDVKCMSQCKNTPALENVWHERRTLFWSQCCTCMSDPLSHPQAHRVGVQPKQILPSKHCTFQENWLKILRWRNSNLRRDHNHLKHFSLNQFSIVVQWGTPMSCLWDLHGLSHAILKASPQLLSSKWSNCFLSR
jgi:hypothetical protein